MNNKNFTTMATKVIVNGKTWYKVQCIKSFMVTDNYRGDYFVKEGNFYFVKKAWGDVVDVSGTIYPELNWLPVLQNIQIRKHFCKEIFKYV